MTTEEFRSSCVKCEDEVFATRRKGKPLLLEAKSFTGYRMDKNGNSILSSVRRAHKCKDTNLNRHYFRARKYLATARSVNGLHYLWGGVPPDLSKAYDVDCPRCEQPAGKKCRNLVKKKQPFSYNSNPHEQRTDAGLEAQNLVVRYDKSVEMYFVAPKMEES